MNALCRVENHRAACYCLPGFSGNPRDSVRGCTRGMLLRKDYMHLEIAFENHNYYYLIINFYREFLLQIMPMANF